MTPRRVLMTTDAVGGVWTYSLELARGLSDAGVEVMLVVIGPPPSQMQRADAIAVRGLILLVPGLPLEWQDRDGPLDLPARQRLQRLARAFEPDLIHCNGFREAAVGFEPPVVVTAHSCVGTWWRACRDAELPPEWSAYADGLRAGLAAASVVVAPSEAFLGDFATTWGPVARSRVIHNGLDIEADHPGRRRRIVLAAGRLWDEAKNVATIAAIAPELPWPVRLAGEASPHEAGSAPQSGRLERKDLLTAMAEAAIFAAPARYEPFGLAILEAAQSGCALVLGDIPSLRELWGDAARFVPPGDPRALHGALLELIADAAALGRAQAAARRRGRHFSRRRMVGCYLELYGDVLARGRIGDRAA
ncbi:MAG: glycosyltransferase family 4 protein [Geminicoccaceae bacterium]